MYAPKLGRFLQTDPIFYKDDTNLYAYVANDPLNKVDPKGTEQRLMGVFSPETLKSLQLQALQYINDTQQGKVPDQVQKARKAQADRERAQARSLRTRVCGQNSGSSKSTAENAVDAVDAMGAAAGVVSNAAPAAGIEAAQTLRGVSTFGTVAGLINVGVNAAQGDFWGGTFNMIDSSVDFVSGLAAGAGAPISGGASILAAGGFMASYHAAGGSEGIARAALCN